MAILDRDSLAAGPRVRVRAFTRLDLHELPGDLETLRLGEVVQGTPLGLNTQP